MRKLITILFLILFTSCNSDDFDINDYPECLRPTIKSIMDKSVQTPKAKIEKWIYNEQEVYVIDAQNFPDGETFVITLNCQETICTLGGFDGPDNDCEDWNTAEFIETIWVDPR